MYTAETAGCKLMPVMWKNSSIRVYYAGGMERIFSSILIYFHFPSVIYLFND